MARVRVEVVYALPHALDRVEVELPAGATVADAVAMSHLVRRHPELRVGTMVTGRFGALVAVDAVVADGERIEVYRPLLADPREARRKRARHR